MSWKDNLDEFEGALIDIEEVPLLDRINADRMEEVADYLEAHPEQHDQSIWYRVESCGTTGCVAGWTSFLSGARISEPDLKFHAFGVNVVLDRDAAPGTYEFGHSKVGIETYARLELGLTSEEADYLFHIRGRGETDEQAAIRVMRNMVAKVRRGRA